MLPVGELVYIDRGFVFTSVPPYQGQEFIRTANDDKSGRESDFLNFTLTAGATVYVAYDDRATSLPAWLGDGWIYTGDMIDTSDVLRRVYEKSSSAGSVTLGAKSMSPRGGARSNYNFIATARKVQQI